MKHSWDEVDDFTAKNIPITQWLDDGTLDMAHGVGLFPDNNYYEFNYNQLTQEVLNKRKLSQEELVNRGMPKIMKIEKKKGKHKVNKLKDSIK